MSGETVPGDGSRGRPPARVRATGFALPYSIGVAVFCGTAPYLQTFLASRGPAWVLSLHTVAMCLVCLATAVLMRETKTVPLD